MDVAELNPAPLKTVSVADAMGSVHTVSANTSMIEAASTLRSRRGRALVVDTGDDSPSIFTEVDIVKVIAAGDSVEGKTVGDHHTRVAIAATPDWTLDRAMETMMRGQFRHLIVVENGRTVGMLSMRDILDTVVEHGEHADAGETVDFAAAVPSEASAVLHNLRRGAKQHLVAQKCHCELDWLEVLVRQAEERADLEANEIKQLWEQRHPCPILNAMGGGGD